MGQVLCRRENARFDDAEFEEVDVFVGDAEESVRVYVHTKAREMHSGTSGRTVVLEARGYTMAATTVADLERAAPEADAGDSGEGGGLA